VVEVGREVIVRGVVILALWTGVAYEAWLGRGLMNNLSILYVKPKLFLLFFLLLTL
jgi:hypothetical protein